MVYNPALTPGRNLYEEWLWTRQTPPDDLWDHLRPEEQASWEALAERIEKRTPAPVAAVTRGLHRVAKGAGHRAMGRSRRADGGRGGARGCRGDSR
jgi:hypothetical protein